MNQRRQTYLYIIASVLLLLSFVMMSGVLAVPSVEAAPLAAESPTALPTQPPPTETFTPEPTETFTPEPTETFTPGPTDTLQPPQTVTPPPPPAPPAEIPEPITVILFGTGLAALSAAAASRRNKKAE